MTGNPLRGVARFYGVIGWAERPTRAHVRSVGAAIATLAAGLGGGLLIAAAGGNKIPGSLIAFDLVAMGLGTLIGAASFLKLNTPPRRSPKTSPLDLVHLGAGSPCIQHTVRRVGTAQEWFEQELPKDPSIERVATLVRLGIINTGATTVQGAKVTLRSSRPGIGFLPTLMHVKDDNSFGSPLSHQGMDVHPGAVPNDYIDIVISYVPGSGRPTGLILYTADLQLMATLPATYYELEIVVTGENVPERVRIVRMETDEAQLPTLTIESGTLLGTYMPHGYGGPDDARIPRH
jgi:hypothetical protein